MQVAAEKLHLQMMELLMKAGADPEAKDWRGKTVRECLLNAKRTNRLGAQKALLLLDKFCQAPERELAAKRLRERGAAPYATPASPGTAKSLCTTLVTARLSTATRGSRAPAMRGRRCS